MSKRWEARAGTAFGTKKKRSREEIPRAEDKADRSKNAGGIVRPRRRLGGI